MSKVPDIGDPFDVEAFLLETVDDKDNAFVDYSAARALLVRGSFPSAEFEYHAMQAAEQVLGVGRSLPSAKVGAGGEKASPSLQLWLDANRPALDRWRLGTEKVDAIDRYLQISDLVLNPTAGPGRDFARLAWLQGEREQSEGQMAEAWQWYRALLRFGRHWGQQTASGSTRLGCYFHNLTAERIER